MTHNIQGPQAMAALLASTRGLPRTFRSGDTEIGPADVDRILGPFVSEERQRRIDHVVAERCGDVAIVVDGLANSGNVAAVMRTAEGLGYLNFHVIRRTMPYKHSKRTTQGTDKWLDVRIWNAPTPCLTELRSAGYRVVAAHLDDRARPLADFDFTTRTAVVFGNELGGVSQESLDLVDETCIIPMSGFAQSFNISVAAATCLYHAREDRLRRQHQHGDLSPEQRTWLRAVYQVKSVAHAQQILDRG